MGGRGGLGGGAIQMPTHLHVVWLFFSLSCCRRVELPTKVSSSSVVRRRRSRQRLKCHVDACLHFPLQLIHTPGYRNYMYVKSLLAAAAAAQREGRGGGVWVWQTPKTRKRCRSGKACRVSMGIWPCGLHKNPHTCVSDVQRAALHVCA